MQGTKQNATMKGEEELPGAEEAVCRWSVGFAGGAAVEAGGGVVAHGRRFQTTVTVSNVRRCYCFFFSFSTRFQLFLPLPMLQSLFFPFPLGFPNGFLCFGSLSLNPIPFFFFLLFLSSLRSLLSGLSPRLFSSPPSLGPIYRAQGVALYCSHGEQPAGRPLGATAKARPPSPVFWQVRGGWSAIVSGRWAPGERVAGKKFELKQPFFPSSPLHVRGGRRKMNSVVQNDTVLLSPFFF
jgi:hypothetical protein